MAEKRKLQKQLKSSVRMERIEIEKKWMAEAKAKKLRSSIAACDAMLSSTGMSINIEYHDINLKEQVNAKLQMGFVKDNLPGIGFVATSSQPLAARGVFYMEYFGLDQSLQLSVENEEGLLFCKEKSLCSKISKMIFRQNLISYRAD